MIEPRVHFGKDRSLWSTTLAASLTLLSLGWLNWVTFRDYRWDTGHLPAAANRIRPVLYGGFFLFIIAAAGAIFTVFWSPQALIQVIYENIYNRRWL